MGESYGAPGTRVTPSRRVYAAVMDGARARELLAAERARLEHAIAALRQTEHESDAERSEPGERGSEELLQTEIDSGLTQDLADQLAAVERAEQRLREGTYGLSVDSGAPIPDARLEAIPTAERTVGEQQALGR
jgi:DnaK suppressor protein